ncbi:histidine--tRNA ligase [Mycoplasmoides pneumoniae]|uniref:Histidine--tRNA ligase n=4 Tax=Mycoplasmoides pneumoniae TaxID=2104 RepID=SYH_MYCPN|nr:histidine--tRNA ligase [Mycoplasmoides pneumoniae]P75069.1 RecName: Full=Histidine--tRNA ligase; AltName: Full=Histidyl-tRNA synthetase; Short=HisRS [Mycoplasmoides pneumoniae M129]AAB95757.1 histidyl-tRNA synthetase [Mycoplasmoides pneumoniae M129]ADK87229.1 histidine--tRNA ligase [Mycoplasmoides pneumoniae FH]AGC03985.1 histidyl-tRNA synthetase [Mycoplasmoides pneumoniae M129-B7]ALA29920.1 histidyl-tRNA synthetase [Mycoplasmoides pneumoniae PI 1428]ALA30889.1 histidyl-tRNA synthetase [My
MSVLQKPRGVKDWYGEELIYFNWTVHQITNLAWKWGFSEVKTPLLEYAEAFKRTNANADIVKKELYEFHDKSNRLLALRPEATAGIVRLVCENKLLQPQNYPLRLFTIGTMYRYERPQSNRYREHYQFSCEVIGDTNPTVLLDTLLLGHAIIQQLGIEGVILKLNNLGNSATIQQWNQALQAYLTQFKAQLTELSQSRLSTNPLRILDDKVDGQLPFISDAPQIEQFLDAEQQALNTWLQQQLTQQQVPFEWNPTLVRGLDYYTGVVFEFVKDDTTVLAGGVYDNLVEELGGTPTKALGFACGIERSINCLSAVKKQAILANQPPRLLVIGLTEAALEKLLQLSLGWRAYHPVTIYPKVIRIINGIRAAQRLGYRFLGVIGGNNLEQQTITVKDLATEQQTTYTWDEFRQRQVL